jgi:hypothetical protein
VASLASLVWPSDRGQSDDVTVRLDDLADKHGLARRRSERAVKHTIDVIAVIKEKRTCDEVRTSRRMAEGTG